MKKAKGEVKGEKEEGKKAKGDMKDARGEQREGKGAHLR